MAVETLLSKDGRAILEVCRRNNTPISLTEAERLAVGMRALFKKGQDGQLRFVDKPEGGINNGADDANVDCQHTQRCHRPRYWRLFFKLFDR